MKSKQPPCSGKPKQSAGCAVLRTKPPFKGGEIDGLISTMNINHLLSTSTANLLSQTKLSSVQSNTINRMEHPLIIPLGGAAALSNPHEMVPVPLLNQQLLVPLAAFQTVKEETLPLLTAIPDSLASSSNSKSQPMFHSLQQESALGIDLSMTKDSSYPVSTDFVQSQILNQSLNCQSKSLFNQNIPVQYTNQRVIDEKEKIKDTTVPKDTKIESCIKMSESRYTKTLSEEKNVIKSVTNSTTSILSNDSYQLETIITNSSSCDANTELDSESLSKVISSLPPGWKVVGLTNLTGADGSQPTPTVVKTHNIVYNTSDSSNDDCVSHLPSLHHRCGVPDVVSIDLNIPTSLSLSSEVFSSSFDNKKMESIILPVDLTDTSTAKSQNVSCQNALLPSSKSIHDTVTGVDPFQVNIKKEVDTTILSEEPSQNNSELDMSKNEWKVIGLTTSSLSQIPVTNTHPQTSSIPLPFPVLLPSNLVESGEERQTNSRSPKATILNVPTPKLVQKSVKSASPQKTAASPNAMSDCNDEVRWTIVGVTMATTTAVSNDSGTDSISTARMKNDKNFDIKNTKADCVVTNSQQRPVSSAESKNAPLSSDLSLKGIDSALIDDQWKVVGITHSTNEDQISPIPPIRYQIPVPLQQVQQTSPMMPVISSSSSASTVEKNLDSNNSTLTSPQPRLSANGILQNSLTGGPNNSMSFVAPSLLPLPLSQSNPLLEHQQLLHLVQNRLHLQLQQQEEQRQLMMGQLQPHLAIQSQIPFMGAAALNKWNLVGLLSNTPSSLISTGNQSGTKELNEKRNILNDKLVATKKYTSQNLLKKEILMSNSPKTPKSHDGSFSELKKSRQNRTKDITARFTKKNTVSHLLKMKRMKMKSEGDDGSISHSDQEGYEVDKHVKHDKDQKALLSRADKAIRSRPLHSYAGNRKIFSKSFTTQIQNDEGKEKINLRSGNQVPVNNLELKSSKKNGTEVEKNLSTQTSANMEVCTKSSPPTDNRSAARKRKLKVPRKMIADVDYQPFDSSSDSN